MHHTSSGQSHAPPAVGAAIHGRRHLRRGFLIVDMVTGLAIVGIIATTLVVLVGRERRLGAALGDRRAAARLAEATLADLRAGRQTAAGATSAENDGGNGPTTQVEVTALADPATPGWRWVQVRATVAGRAVTLVGLVPEGPGLPAALPSTRPATTEAQVQSSESNAPTQEAP